MQCQLRLHGLAQKEPTAADSCMQARHISPLPNLRHHPSFCLVAVLLLAVTYKNGRDSKPGESKPPVIKLSADIVPGKAFFFPSLSIDMGGWEVSPALV